MNDTLKTRTIEVTMFGETREIEFHPSLDGRRFIERGASLVGRFPTGTKLHRTAVTLDRRNANLNHPLRGETAAMIDGEEYVTGYVLYTHNRNVGRITGWYEAAQADVIAKW